MSRESGKADTQGSTGIMHVRHVMTPVEEFYEKWGRWKRVRISMDDRCRPHPDGHPYPDGYITMDTKTGV